MKTEGFPRLFGTDGIRGRADQFPLDKNTLYALGQVLGQVLGSEPPAGPARSVSGSPRRVLVGGDTRESSPRIAAWIAAGLKQADAEVIYAGVITTPAIAFLTREYDFQAGLMVSASHNPYPDNGVKIFSPQGEKIDRALEQKIEGRLWNTAADPPPGTALTLTPHSDLVSGYVNHLAGLIPQEVDLGRFQLVVDCAHGAASQLAPRLAEKLRLNCTFLNCQPDGKNINRDCGSLHPEEMARVVTQKGAHLGVALDGDADRAILATEQGEITDGDGILWVASQFLKRQGRLAAHHVVGTVMTNYGLERSLREKGVRLTRTPVGDKYVLDEMLRSGAKLGGEPSGHIIFADFSMAGDGLVSLLMVLRILAESGSPLGKLVGDLEILPQRIRNVSVKSRPPLESVEEIQKTIERCRERIGDRGRIVVRYSGTEPLVRVMVEVEDEALVTELTAEIAQSVRKHLA